MSEDEHSIKNEHPVAACGSGYLCLAHHAVYYVSIDTFLSGSKEQEVFEKWDKEHGAIHRRATLAEIKAYDPYGKRKP